MEKARSRMLPMGTAVIANNDLHTKGKRVFSWLASSKDEGLEQRRITRNAYFILIGIIPMAILLPQYALHISPVEKQWGGLLAVIAAILFVFLLCLLKLGIKRFISHAIVGINCGIVFATLARNGGIRDTTLILVPVILIFASVLLSNRAVLLYGIFLFLGVIALYWAEIMERLPVRFADVVTADQLLLVLTVIGLITLYLYNSYTRLVNYAKQFAEQSHSLQETIDELQEIRHSLEMRTQELMTLNDHLRNTQKQLVEAEKMASLGSLVAGVAHEINTPLGISVTAASTLSTVTEELKTHYESGQFRRSQFEFYLATATKGSQLILGSLQRVDQLMQSFKQLAVDQLTLERRTFRLRAYLEEIIRGVEPMLRAGHHSIALAVSSEIEIYSYPGALAQVIINLITNSVTHGYADQTNGHLYLSAQQEGNRIQLVYRDEGSGISQEHLGKIYEPFFTTARDRGGTGLGLHVVYNLVRQRLGGTIHHASEIGHGVTFYLDLPLSVGDE